MGERQVKFDADHFASRMVGMFQLVAPTDLPFEIKCEFGEFTREQAEAIATALLKRQGWTDAMVQQMIDEEGGWWW